MVSDRQVTVWQSDGRLHIECHYYDDPLFSLEQETVLHAIARSFLLENRQIERRKRQRAAAKERKKKDEQDNG